LFVTASLSVTAWSVTNLVSDDLVSDGLVSDDLVSDGLVCDDLGSNGLVSVSAMILSEII
jgi:hypothetical protein